GLPKEDVRYKKAFDWVSKNYSVTENAGLAQGDRGYYYYLYVMAGCLDSLGVDEVTDAKGKKHAWRGVVMAALGKRQRKDVGGGRLCGRWRRGSERTEAGPTRRRRGWKATGTSARPTP